jgi:CRP-like cAMP-binding protein
MYLSSREARESLGPREEGRDPVAATAGSAADHAPSALQLRVRMLEMSPVFGELADGPLRALARRMRVVGLPAADKLKLGTDRGDAVVFLASGLVDQSLTDAAGRVLLTRRRLPGDLVILPVHRAGDRYVTSIDGIANAVLLTLDRDSLIEGLGADVEKIAGSLDQLWAQELAAVEAAEAQTASRSAAPIVAFFSAKGGSGATTLAVNTAAALARTYPRQVLLIDLSAPFGHAALFSDLIATGSIASASKAAPADFDKVLRQHIVYHRSGMGVLPGTLRPEEVDLLTGEVVGRVLDIVVSWPFSATS